MPEFTVTRNMTVADAFEKTDLSFEESGSLIHIYQCRICDEQCAKYSRHTHLWYHKYQAGFDV